MVSTKVIFRKWRNGEIIALFPYEIVGKTKDDCQSYMHMGQHSVANYRYVVGVTYPASQEEYQPLYDELIKIGYHSLEIIHRRNQKGFDEMAKHYEKMLNFFK